MTSPASDSAAGAHLPARNVRGAPQAHNSSPGFDPRFPADHADIIFLSPRRTEVVPRTAAEYRQIEQEERRRTRREQDCVLLAGATGVNEQPMRHHRHGASRRR